MNKEMMIDKITDLKKQAVKLEKKLEYDNDPNTENELDSIIIEINYLADCVYELEDAENNIS